MKNLFKTLFCLVVTLSSMSCSKFLDINPGEFKPVKDKFYKTEADFRISLIGAYAIMTNGEMYGNRLHGRAGLEVDEAASAYNSDNGAAALGLYNGWNPSHVRFEEMYKQLYKGVNLSNEIIHRIDDSDVPSGVERDHLVGQAYFLRGLYYHYLANFYGGVPIVEFVADKHPEDYMQPRNSLKEVVEYMISDFKMAASLLKPMSEVQMGIQATKSAAWGYLARAYLMLAGDMVNLPQGDRTAHYAEAAKYAKMVIDDGYHMLNSSYSQIFINLAQDILEPREVIFEVNFIGIGSTPLENKIGSAQGRNNGILNRNPGNANGGSKYHSEGVIAATPYLYRLYRNTNGVSMAIGDDKRHLHNMPDFYYNGTNGARNNVTQSSYERGAYVRYCGKFRRENEIIPSDKTPGTMYTAQNVVLLRFADIKLMYAEALMRSDPSKYAEAIGHVNDVRMRSIEAGKAGRLLSVTPPSGTDIAYTIVAEGNRQVTVTEAYGAENVLIRHIIEERARELCYEGLRKNDLNRWGIFYKRAMAGKEERHLSPSNSYAVTGGPTIATSTIPGNSITASWNYYNNIREHHKLWAIPQSQIDLNPLLIQNPGY